MSAAIRAQNLKKEFFINKPAKTRLARLRHYFIPVYEKLQAVDNISFEILPGEKVAFIGPNGAGKSTTIKLLTGIFQPTIGNVQILGIDPFKNRKQAAYKIGAVFGQRSQLWYHLPAVDSFNLLAAIYNIPSNEFKKRLDHLSQVFHLHSFIFRPIKELSLGERMRCELVASLLHHPQILFLDEPTIGLDIISKSAIRELIRQRAEQDSTTIFLTSHDIADIEKVCDRIILINKGSIIIDDSVKAIKQKYLYHKWITIKSNEPLEWRPHPAIRLLHQAYGIYKFEVDLCIFSSQEALHYLSGPRQFFDITIEDPPLEDVIKRIYQS